jgi:hypothetical protein
MEYVVTLEVSRYLSGKEHTERRQYNVAVKDPYGDTKEAIRIARGYEPGGRVISVREVEV